VNATRTTHIGIIGLGWLGYPLASFLNSRGYRAWGTTTSRRKLSHLRELGIEAYPFKLEEEGVLGDLEHLLEESSALVLNIPPGLRNEAGGGFISRIRNFSNLLQQYPSLKLLFVSSTSVFGRSQGSVWESSNPRPENASGAEILEAEGLLSSERPGTTILRPGGLIGGQRHPVLHLAGRKGLPNGDDPVNLVQRSDLVRLMYWILQEGHWGETVHAVYPDHPGKSDYYTAEARARGLVPPIYEPSPDDLGKIVLSTFASERGFSYQHPIRSEKA